MRRLETRSISDIIKGYEVGKGQYIEIEPEELEAIAIDSKRTIEIDEFVPKNEIDELYLNSPLRRAHIGRWLLSVRLVSDVVSVIASTHAALLRKSGMLSTGL